MACQFDTERKCFTFKWFLENFEFCEQKTGTFLKSPTFIVDNIEKSKWSLLIYPRGVELENWIALYLNREEDSKGPATIEIDYDFAFLASDGSVLTSESVYKGAFLKDYSDGYPEFEERESVFTKRSTFLPQGVLTIQCRLWKSNGKVRIDEHCIARTRIGVERKKFLWKIKKFSSFNVGQEMTFRLKSTSDDKTIMSLKLFLRKNGSSYSIVIKFINSDKNIVFSTFKSFLVDAQRVDVECGKHEFWFSPAVQSECMLSLSKDTLMDKSTLYLPQNTLTLYCVQAFSVGTVLEEIESTAYECSPSFLMDNLVPGYIKTADIKESSSDLKGDLHSMLQDNILCDITLCAESETFRVHRFILSARSPVFRAMLRNDTKDKAKDEIIIEAAPDTVRHMLLYMYTNSLEGLIWEIAFELYVVAFEYQIMTLMDKCSAFLKSNLRLSNVHNIFQIAHLLGDKELESAAACFIWISQINHF
ncbi:hypothetical protein AVEN_124022-1 [Araneus ventricosus]|uniref:Speckle-type POZ protein n=1 Tax=Araneus ventricosus TaxID=182803 RepID=A0A4Y2KZH4_ARAVE|nr:hypothetical protein AVEN_124022-1 [Araneus ventricosus]